MANSLVEEIQDDEVDLTKLSSGERRNLQLSRWRARYDLLYLMNKVLGKEDVSLEFNGKLISHLQQFPRPTLEQSLVNDNWTDGPYFTYSPLVPNMLDLTGKRNKLIIDHRSSFKTTINCEGHTIQWLLNYPLTCIGIFQYNLEKAEGIIQSIKHHFCHNARFRALFPELCPPKDKVNDFGTQTQFSIWGINKLRKTSRRESSVMAAALSAGLAGYHFEQLKFSDVVEPKNTQNEEQCQKTIHEFGQAKYLLMSSSYWRDVEGTRYHFADLYGKICEEWQKSIKAGKEPMWDVYTRSVFKPAVENPEFTPNELEADDFLDENKRPVTWCPDPKRFSVDDLLYDEANDPTNFAAQMRNRPIGGRGGIPDFPVIINRETGLYESPAVISLEEFQKVPIAYTIMSVDAAYTVSERSDYNAFVVADVDRIGRFYVKQLVNEKLESKDVSRMIVRLCDKYKPHYLNLEDVNFARGLQVGLEWEWDHFPLMHHKPTIRWTKRSNQKTKEESIRLTLAYFYNQKELRFVKESIDKEAWEHLIRELRTFPRGTSDNILDALTDLFYNKTWYGVEYPLPPASDNPILRPEDIINFSNPSEATMLARLSVAAGINNIYPSRNSHYQNFLDPETLVNQHLIRPAP